LDIQTSGKPQVWMSSYLERVILRKLEWEGQALLNQDRQS
jgi:hypothetical protein